MNIGIVCYPSIGGSGIVAANLGNELAKRGHKVHFVSYDAPFRLAKHQNIHFHQVHINEYDLFKYPDYTLPLAVALGAIHKKYKLDILHVHYAVPHATAALLAEDMLEHAGIKPPRIITTLHGTDITLLAKNRHLFEIIKYSIERSSRVTAVSRYLKNQTREILKIRKPIEVIHNFFTPSRLNHSREWIRRKLGFDDKDFVAIHLSNLRGVKRIPDLLKIVKLMSAKGAAPASGWRSASGGKKQKNFKLLILSGGDFSQYQPLVKKFGIQKQILVKQNIPDIENYINAAEIGLYTSDEESFGLSILETMSLGRPVVASLAGGVPEVVDDGKTGILCKVGDIAGFAKAVKKLMNDGELRQKMGETAKNRAREKFSTKKIVDEYVKYYGHFS